VAGLLVSAVGVSGTIGSADFYTAAGFLLLGVGTTAVAWDTIQPGGGEPAWVPFGAGVFLATARIGLSQALSSANHTTVSSALTLVWALVGAIVFGLMVHL